MNLRFSNNRQAESPASAHYTARIVSDLANPLFIPPFVLALVGHLRYLHGKELAWMTALSLLFYTLIPMGYAIYLHKTGRIESMDLPRRETRNVLFLYAAISSSVGSVLLGVFFYLYHPFLTMTAVIFLLNPLLGYLINLKWKISMHTASIASGGTIFFMLFYMGSRFYISAAGIFSLFMLLILLPVMIWARYHLKIHTAGELLGGALAGILFTLLEFGIMIRFW